MYILVVDDNTQVRKLLIKFLSQNGHEAVAAEDGQEGWDIFDSSKKEFDVILSDIMMPEMNGLELLEKLRENECNVPVIIITGYAAVNLTLKAFKLGAFDFLVKPLDFKVLLSSLNKIESFKSEIKEIIDISRFYNATVEYSLPSQTKYIPSLIPSIQKHYISLCELSKINKDAISSCVFEAVQNAIIYGNLDLDPTLREESQEAFTAELEKREADPNYADKKVKIIGHFCEKFLKLEIEDQGKGFDNKAFKGVNKETELLPKGRGLFIIKLFMDDVIWNESGNKITMIKYLKKKKDE